MGSSIEVFDAGTLDHVTSHRLRLLDEGSVTWFDKYRDGYVAGFAHYDGSGGVGFKDHRYSSVVSFDAEWRRTGMAVSADRRRPHGTRRGVGRCDWP